MEKPSITGQVVHKRTPSKKICFLDIQISPTNPEEGNTSATCPIKKTAILKSWVSHPDLMKKALKGKSKIHVGDTVRFEIYDEDLRQIDKESDNSQRDDRPENSNNADNDMKEVTVKSFTILERWAEKNPGVAFLPTPPTATNQIRNVESRSPDQKLKICKFWLNTGQCPKRENCAFRHISHENLIRQRQEYVQDKLERRARIQNQFDDQGDESNNKKTDDHQLNSLSSRHQRASKFADFLLKTFPDILPVIDDKKNAHLILDVAGGVRGDVGFELKVKRKIGSSVLTIDPRSPTSTRKRWQTKLLRKDPTCQPPNHKQQLFNEALLAQLDCTPSLILGMHPDEATEPIVDLSLKYQIPFAVVPCCVFAHLSPNRRLRSGLEPTTYELYCQFLREKNPEIREESLGFRGRDKVIYWRPRPTKPVMKI